MALAGSVGATKNIRWLERVFDLADALFPGGMLDKIRGSRKKKGSDREERVVDSTRYLTSASLSSAETVTTVEGGRDAIKEEREVDARSSLGVMLDFFRNN